VARVVLVYLVFSSLWILLSDRLMILAFRGREAIFLASSLKGLAFVLVTAGLLYLVTGRQVQRLMEREEQSLRQERERAHALRLMGVLVEASGDAIYAKDDQGRYLLANRATGRIVGRDPASLVGKDDRELFPPGEATAMMARDRQVLEEGVGLDYEETLTTTAGATTFLTSKGPIRDADGRVCGLFGIARDITLRKQMEDDLRASEQKFSNIFQMSPNAIDLTQLESGLMMDCNQGYAQVYGFTREEAIGMTTVPGGLGVWVDAGDRDRHVAELDASGLSLGFQAQMRHKDGHTFIAEISSSVLEFKGVRYNLSLSRDITAQKRAEEALRESSQRLELAIRAAGLGIWDRDPDTGRMVWNDRMYELHGRDRQDGPPDLDAWLGSLVHPEDRARMAAAIRDADSERQAFDLEYRGLRPDGGVRYFKSSGLVLHDDQGKAVRVIGVVQDRTRQVEGEAEQRRLQAELQHAEKLESLGSLAGGVAHDMNNVLAAILGIASTLRLGCAEGDPQAASLDTITRACGRGRDVVRSLLYFARQDLEAMGPVDLNIIVEEVVHLLNHTTLRRIDIATDLQAPLGLIEGDGAALSHALINLCVNAADAMPEGGSLRLSTRREGDTVRVRVVDTGLGMSPEVARKAIEPFFTTKPVGKGTGLGLAMVYGAVKAHKGTFEIRSESGRGTEVVLGFPALAQAAGTGHPVPAGADPGARSPLRILLVDDDELIRASVGPMLALLGHEVHTAEGGQEALERIQGGLDVDLVILDMNMPGLNGAQTLERLLALRPDQKVVMATGYSDETIAPLLAGRPNLTSLHKPFSLAEVRARLAGLGLGSPRPPSTGP
jgi:PAS domain S-box-containing protein